MTEVSFVNSDISHIKHAFFTRQGGVSPTPFESLNVARHVGDDAKNADENRLRALAAVHVKPEDFVFLGRLEHSNRIIEVDNSAGGLEMSEHDAIMTNRPGLALGLSVADCLPIIIVDESAPALALVHAGWRGLKAEVVERAVTALTQEYGAEPENMKAVIGPSIGPDNYEVGQEVSEQFPKKYIHTRAGVITLDLWSIAEDQLSESGVAQFENLRLDTFSDERFFSHRREGGKTGRFLALACL